MAKLELFGSARCPHTQEMRDWLEFRRCQFVEYDVDADAAALQRLVALENGQRNVPLLVEDGNVVSVGWQGRSCAVGSD